MAVSDGIKFWQEIQEDVCIAAYGSNLVEDRMVTRCPSAVPVGTSVICGYRMLFKQSMTGAYATIEQDANRHVPVLIYKVTAEDEARLDRFEGFPRYYRKQEFYLPVKTLDGKKRRKRISCIAYIMREHRMLGEPCGEYFSLLDEGYSRWGFDHEILFLALDDSIGKKESNKWLKRFYKENAT